MTSCARCSIVILEIYCSMRSKWKSTDYKIKAGSLAGSPSFDMRELAARMVTSLFLSFAVGNADACGVRAAPWLSVVRKACTMLKLCIAQPLYTFYRHFDGRERGEPERDCQTVALPRFILYRFCSPLVSR